MTDLPPYTIIWHYAVTKPSQFAILYYQALYYYLVHNSNKNHYTVQTLQTIRPPQHDKLLQCCVYVVYMCICHHSSWSPYTTTCPRSTLASNIDFYFQPPPVYLQWATVASGSHKECKSVWEDNRARTGISNTLWPPCTVQPQPEPHWLEEGTGCSTLLYGLPLTQSPSFRH